MKNRAFTLIELLVVMALIGALASMTAVMMAGAQRQANETRTERQIDMVEQVLLTRLGEMGFSPVPFVLPVANTATTQTAARVRLMGRRDQLRMAFPDRRADLLFPPAQLRYANGAGGVGVTKIQPPPAWGRMRTRLGLGRPPALPSVGVNVAAGDIGGSGGSVYPGDTYEVWGRRFVGDPASHIVPVEPVPSGTNVSLHWTLEHESAECLWLILSVTEFNGIPALDILGNSFVANTDGDAVPEIIDSWGNPMAFIRWPIGAQSQDIQSAGPDAFDYLRTDYRYADPTAVAITANDPINLQPMIVSAGSDGEFGIRLTIGDNYADYTNPLLVRRFSFASTTYTGTSSAALPPAPYVYPDPYVNVRNYVPIADGTFDPLRNDITRSRTRSGLGSPLPLDTSVNPDSGPLSEFVLDNVTNLNSRL